MPIPPYKQLSNHVIKALQQFGGTASVEDLERVIAKMLELTPQEIAEIHKGTQTKLHYRIAWTRFYLKKQGFLESSKRGVSVLSEKGRSVNL